MTKRSSILERVIHRLDDKIAALQFAREELLEQQRPPVTTPAPSAKKRIVATAQEG